MLLLRGVQAQRRAHKVRLRTEMARDQHVVENRHLLEQTDVLEGTGDAELRDLVRCLGDNLVAHQRFVALIKLLHLPARMVLHDRLAVKIDGTVGRLIHTRDDIEGCRLAGTVRADQRDDLALVDFHRKIIDRHHAAKLHGDMLQAKHIRIRITHLRMPPFPCACG